MDGTIQTNLMDKNKGKCWNLKNKINPAALAKQGELEQASEMHQLLVSFIVCLRYSVLHEKKHNLRSQCPGTICKTDGLLINAGLKFASSP